MSNYHANMPENHGNLMTCQIIRHADSILTTYRVKPRTKIYDPQAGKTNSFKCPLRLIT